MMRRDGPATHNPTRLPEEEGPPWQAGERVVTNERYPGEQTNEHQRDPPPRNRPLSRMGVQTNQADDYRGTIGAHIVLEHSRTRDLRLKRGGEALHHPPAFLRAHHDRVGEAMAVAPHRYVIFIITGEPPVAIAWHQRPLRTAPNSRHSVHHQSPANEIHVTKQATDSHVPRKRRAFMMPNPAPNITVMPAIAAAHAGQ
jgi:hypothetical protein